MTPPRGRGNLIQFALIGVVSFVVDLSALFIVRGWLDSINAGSIPSDRIISASNAMIQLDSFMIAGFIVGFFYLWERMEAQSQEISLKPLVVLSFSTLIAFALSGLLAVGAILTADFWYLKGAILLLIYSVWSVLFNWYGLQSMIGGLKK